MLNSLVLALAIIGQTDLSKESFSMVGPPDRPITVRVEYVEEDLMKDKQGKQIPRCFIPPEEKQSSLTPQVVIKTVEIPVYYAQDATGQWWHDRDREVLNNHIRNQNKKAAATQWFYGVDSQGRTWRATSPEQLQRDLAPRVSVGWPQQYINTGRVASPSSFSTGGCYTNSAGVTTCSPRK